MTEMTKMTKMTKNDKNFFGKKEKIKKEKKIHPKTYQFTSKSIKS